MVYCLYMVIYIEIYVGKERDYYESCDYLWKSEKKRKYGGIVSAFHG